MFQAKTFVLGLAVLLVGLTGSALAASVHYVGKPVDGNAREFVSFDLNGDRCQDGSKKCIDLDKGAKVTKFGAVSWSYPNCPEILEGAFQFKKSLRVDKDGGFGGTEKTPWETITVKGKINEEKAKARGTFTVESDGCSTGTRKWTAKA